METERLFIRRLCLDDAPALCAVLSDPQVMRYVEPPFTLQKTADFIKRFGMCSPPLVYAVIEKSTGWLIGHLIWHPYDAHAMELGWILRKDRWGLGYAQELTRCMLSEAVHSVVLECHPRQAATRHIAEKYGFILQEETDERLLFHWKKETARA